MRNLVYGFNVSLDGYFEDQNGSIDWSEPDEELHRYWNDVEATSDTHLYGRRLWEVMGGYWPTAVSTQCCRLPPGRNWCRNWLAVSVVMSRVRPQSGWWSALAPCWLNPFHPSRMIAMSWLI